MEFETILRRSGATLPRFGGNFAHRSLPIALKLRHDRGGPRRHSNNTVLERALPECVKAMQLFLAGENVRAPEFTQVCVMVGFIVAQPPEQGFLRRARFKERGNQRLS